MQNGSKKVLVLDSSLFFYCNNVVNLLKSKQRVLILKSRRRVARVSNDKSDKKVVKYAKTIHDEMKYKRNKPADMSRYQVNALFQTQLFFCYSCKTFAKNFFVVFYFRFNLNSPTK